jgi:cell volume regulation protein A
MDITVENVILIGSILLFISILAGKTSYRFGVPTLLFFIGVGILAGSEGIGGIYFDSPELAQFIGLIALNIILFSGGLDTDWKHVKPIIGQGALLSTLGVLLTAGTVGLFVSWITDFTLIEGLLLGSIVSSTDAAAVFSILRSKSVNLKNNIRPILELESGSNDPMAYFLTITFTSMVLVQDQEWSEAVINLILQIFLGALLGFAFGKFSKWIINKITLDFEGLYPVLGLALCFITFSVTDAVGGNGFLAIYICAVMLGNTELIHKRSLVRFFDGFAWLMQIILFLTLGLLVFPSQVLPVVGVGLLVSVFMIFFARPLSVFISLIPFRQSIRSKFFISWVGLRGAVPIVFATYPMVAGIEKADIIFNIVFFITLVSVTLQGTTLPVVAKWLKVKDFKKKPLHKSQALEFADSIKTTSYEIKIRPENPVVGKKIFELGLPTSSLIVMIERDNNYFIPSGSTEINAGDVLLIISNTTEGEEDIYKFLYAD